MNQCLSKNNLNFDYFKSCKTIEKNHNCDECSNDTKNETFEKITEKNDITFQKKERIVFSINELEKPTINAVLNQVPLVYDPITKQLLLQSKSKSSQTSEDKSSSKNFLNESTSSEIASTNDENLVENFYSNLQLHDSLKSDSLELLESKEDLLHSKENFEKDKIKNENNTEFFSSSSSSNISRKFSLLTSSLSLPSTFQNVVNRLKKKKTNQTIVHSTTVLILENRPFNLPAKDAHEEEKHRNEYEKMVKEAKRKEIKSLKLSKKLAEKKLKKEGQVIESIKFWQKIILSDWDKLKNSKKVKELWWQGLPSNIRGQVWKMVIGNDLNIDVDKFNLCIDNINSNNECFEMIKLDVSRTFPHLGFFQENNGPYHSTLSLILFAYNSLTSSKSLEAKKCPSNTQTLPTGYCQGMSFLAAMLILNLSTPFDAFIAFSNLIHKTQLLKCFFQVNQRVMKAYYSTYSLFFQFNIPLLYEHFAKQKLTPDLYLVDWIYTLFSKSLPLDISTHIWDLFLRDEDEFIFRCSIAILKMYSNVLIKMDFMNLAQFLTKLPEDIDEDSLFLTISKIKMTLEEKNFKKSFQSVFNSFLEVS